MIRTSRGPRRHWSRTSTQPQLHLPRRRHRRADPAERRERRFVVGGAGERDQRWRAEVGAVEEVEHLEPELDAAAGPSARQGICRLNARSTVRRSGPMSSPRPVLPNVPGRLQHERRRDRTTARASPVTALVGAAARRVARPIEPDARRRATATTASATGWSATNDGQRLPLRIVADAGHLPAVEQRAARRREASGANGRSQHRSSRTQLCSACRSPTGPCCSPAMNSGIADVVAVGRVGEERRRLRRVLGSSTSVYDDCTDRPRRQRRRDVDDERVVPGVAVAALQLDGREARGSAAACRPAKNSVPSASVVGVGHVDVAAAQQVRAARAGVADGQRPVAPAAPAAR